MKLSFKTILPIILISALLILLAGCFGVPADESPGYTPGTITGIIAAPCCSTSAEPVSETCCVSPEYWCYYCQETWKLQDGIEVVLTYGEDEVATTTTNDKGEFTFTNVDPGKNYVVTAYCPDFADNRPLVKDVALQLVEGGSFDTNITDLVSTSLGLVVDFLVQYTEWGPEDISLDAVLADRPTFPNFPKFKKLVYEVRRVLENCELNLLTDDEVQYRTCLAAEEISGLDIGCGAGFTPPGPPPPPPGECDDNLLPDITDVTQDGTSIFNINPALVADIHLTVGTPYEFCVTAADNDNILPQALIYYLTIDGVYYSTGNSNCMTITPETEDVDSNPHEVFVNVYDGCDTKTWGPITVIVDCCPFGEPGLTINIEEPVANEMGIEMSKNGEPEPIPDITICMEDCAIINSVTIHYGGTYPLPELVITDFLNDTSLTWDIPTGIDFTKTTDGATVCLIGGAETGIPDTYTIGVTYTDPCDVAVSDSVYVEFEDCTCVPPTAEADGPYAKTVCPGIVATIDFDSTITSGTGPFTYAWTFGDGGTSTDADPSHTYPIGASVYNVTLVVTNACGDSTYQTTVAITECINTAPKVNGLPIRQAISAVSYQSSCIPTYRFTVGDYASDDVGDILTYSFVGDKPTGMTIDPGSGEIVWEPECISIGSRCHECGLVCVTVRVQDDGCCQPLYTDVKICIEVWNGWIDTGAYVGIGFDGCPIGKYSCP